MHRLCVRLCAAAQRLFKRISMSLLPWSPAGRFLRRPLPSHAGQAAAARPAARGPCGAASPPPPATLIGVFVYTSGTRAGRGCPRPIGRPAPRPGDVTGGGTGPLLARPGGSSELGGGRGGAAPARRAEIAVPGSGGRDSPWALNWL
ncbi:protein yippee-like 1 isoform X1 [Corvus moneduloides]|uniref:protein yippee-like 1 isoform X1 n=1 Tax=Corvus moneduloides TaxID=1196302 RepID=UPI00136312FF|nr:protein yippee-like 1 isoform X1 [Corvus moneduloides]